MKSKGKKTMGLASMVGIFIMSTSLVVSAAEPGGTVITDQGYVYKSASVTDDLIDTFPIGTNVSILETTEAWYQVYDIQAQVKGWMSQDAVSIEQSTDQIRKGKVTANILNVRTQPTTNSDIVKKLPEGTPVSIVGQEADWYQIVLTGTLTGWVSGEYIALVPNFPEAIIGEQTVLLYEDQTAATVIKELKSGEKIYLQSYEEEWYQVVLSDFTSGWLKSDAVIPAADLTADANRSGFRTGALDGIEAIASQYIGSPYQYGRTGPDRFDCSGFISYIFNTYYKDYLSLKGISLPRSSRDQANIGTPVGREDLQIGDLVFFNTTSSRSNAISHVAIYIGGGRIIHAPSSGGSVRIDSLNDRYYTSRYVKAVRL